VSFITKPLDIANRFNDYFTSKVKKLSCEMTTLNSDCCFEFGKVSVGEVGKLLLSINNEKPPGIDNRNGKPLRMVAGCHATPICYTVSLTKVKKECMSTGVEGS
jgi:hypothetical protein